MNHFWSYLCANLPALVAAVTAAVAAWKSHAALQGVEAVRAVQAVQLAQSARAAPVAPPGAEAPGFSVSDAFRYADLLTRVMEAVKAVRSLPSNVPGEIPLIRGVRVNGRKADLGPLPIVFRD